MGKRVVIGLVAVIGLLAIWRTDAEAQCLSWRTIGGSSMCVAWATKGVQVQITFKDGCFVAGEGGDVQGCNVFATATNTDTPTSIAFCSNVTNTNTVKVACDQPFSFIGNVSPATPCAEHPDNESPTGEAHERHHCVAAVTLIGTSCDPCCPAEFPVCKDLTPVEMHTKVHASYSGGGAEVPFCSPGSSVCNVEETCSINPKKIALITNPSQGRQYQCNIDCMGTGPGGCLTE